MSVDNFYVKVGNTLKEMFCFDETEGMLQVGECKWINKRFALDACGKKLFPEIKGNAQVDMRESPSRRPSITKAEIYEAKLALGLA